MVPKTRDAQVHVRDLSYSVRVREGSYSYMYSYILSKSLPAPSMNLTVTHVALGHGIQHYTCASENATATALGALAVIYDITPLYPEMTFASYIIRREEGLMLKPDELYFSFGQNERSYASCYVKLKKGYIKGMGDISDLAIVSGRYCPTRAKVLKKPTAKYTHFYLSCLTNKDL
ncbi:hypothetical protein F5883DRAFT_649684 [Diaporthe sp. PMI_573]|nr:hypothetical protein F5883DRAFT_649684 [Diaporthaceae sp. PMI_573]